jgi:hypothetical protein
MINFLVSAHPTSSTPCAGISISDYRNRLRVAFAKDLLSQTSLDMESWLCLFTPTAVRLAKDLPDSPRHAQNRPHS